LSLLYCIVSIRLYSASCSAHQSEALPVRETQRKESSPMVPHYGSSIDLRVRYGVRLRGADPFPHP